MSTISSVKIIPPSRKQGLSSSALKNNKVSFSGVQYDLETRTDFLREFQVLSNLLGSIYKAKEHEKYEYLDEFLYRRVQISLPENLRKIDRSDALEKFLQRVGSKNRMIGRVLSRFVQPVTSETVRIIAEETARAKKLGVEASFSYDTDMARRVNDLLEAFKRAGYPRPDCLVVYAPNTSERFAMEKRLITKTYQYGAPRRIYRIKPIRGHFYPDVRMNIGLFSFAKGGLEHVLKHEIGHMLHFQRDASLFDYLRAYDFTFKPKYNQMVERQLGGYATTSPLEFVAEAFVRLVNGRKLSDKLMILYRKLKGPVIRGILRK